MTSAVRRDVFIIVVVWMATTFIGFGERELWNPIEPRYAGVCAEVLRTGEWLVPTSNGVAFDQKPPLYFWLGAGFLRLAPPGWEKAAVRLPSAVGALLMALGTWALGRRLLGPREARWAACFLLTSWLVFWSSRYAHLDTLLGTVVVWLVWLGVAGQGEGRGDSSQFSVPRRRLVGFGASLVAVGLLLKGPAVIVWPLLVFGVDAVRRRDLKRLHRTNLLPSLAIGLTVAAGWFFVAWRTAGSDWARELLIDQGIGRLADTTQPSKHGPFYYLWNVVLIGAPWTLLLPFAGWAAWRARRDDPTGARTLVLGWGVVVVALLSFGVTRRGRYLMPMLPAAMLLVAWWLALPDRRRLRRFVAVMIVVVAVATAIWGTFGAPAVDQARDDVALVTAVRPFVQEGRRVVTLGRWGRRESTAGWLGFHLATVIYRVPRGGTLPSAWHDESIVLLVERREIERGRSKLPTGFVRVAGPLSHWDVDVYRN